MTNIKLLEKFPIDEKRIKEIAQQSAKYLLDIFNKEGTSAFTVICMLAQCCMERNEIAAYVKILMYCRKTGHLLPEHYSDIAANTEEFDFYCRQLLYYLIEFSQ